jgi:hypothetical protein
MKRGVRLLAIMALLAVGGLPAKGSTAGAPACDQSPLSFRTPIRLGTGQGYEPGVDADSKGTIFVTAHKYSLGAEEGTRLASYLWRSADGGRTFQDVSGLSGLTKEIYGFEGDLAVDGKDRLYIVETWSGDSHVYRYSDHGRRLDFYRPAVPTAEPDDRPWVTAHGDGVVYYMANSGVNEGGRLFVHRSTDGGLTFDAGVLLPKSGWGFLDADPHSKYVYAVANDVFFTAPPSMYVWVSPDAGLGWKQIKIAPYEFGYDVSSGHEDGFPTIAVSPKDGSVYVLWSDDGRALRLAHSVNHGRTWKVYDVTPFKGDYSYPWVTVGPNGDVGIIFQATPDFTVGRWVYGMIWHPDSNCRRTAGARSFCTGPSAGYARLTPGRVIDQQDFFQAKFTPDDALNVPFAGQDNVVMFTREVRGSNLAHTRSCGIVGSP